MEFRESKLRVLNRDVIKYVAMLTMLLNHISHVFLTKGTILHEVFEDVGYFTAITMCYFLVEGYEYTKSKKKYAMRLLLFAIISEVPFVLAFGYPVLNMLFTLFFCFMILIVLERVQNNTLQTYIVVCLVFITAFCDWPFMAAIFTVMFANNKNSRKKMVRSYGIAFLIFTVFNSMNYAGVEGYSAIDVVFHSVLSAIPLLVSGFVILNMYNGKRAEKGRKFSKWFFYIFYPGHLLVLWLISRFVM